MTRSPLLHILLSATLLAGGCRPSQPVGMDVSTQPATRAARSRGGPGTGAQSAASYAVVPIFYGTNRTAAGRDDERGIRYGSTPSESLDVGVCEVSIPRDHRMGHLETPSIHKLEMIEDPERHVVLQRVTRMDEAAFLRAASRRVGRSARREAFVFVHGFNVNFADAARRTAQVAYDLGFDGAPFLFSWPSLGMLSEAAYTDDTARAAASAPALRRFLETVRDRTGAKEVHLIAHSMGNQVLTAALAQIASAGAPATRPAAPSILPGKPPRAAFNHVVLTAPDLDAEVFKNEILPAIRPAAGRVTLYASANDRALRYSRNLHRDRPRAGEAGADLLVCDGVDTIDVSAIDTSLTGHSYYGDNVSVISDLYHLLSGGKRPHERQCLDRLERDGLAYWQFRASCVGGH